jgi:hypothetical protein
MPAVRELLEMFCSHLQVIGYLYILGSPIDRLVRVFNLGVSSDGIQQSR